MCAIIGVVGGMYVQLVVTLLLLYYFVVNTTTVTVLLRLKVRDRKLKTPITAMMLVYYIHFIIPIWMKSLETYSREKG